ncbi:hypothetical protein QJS10_CPB21g00752 [Acorus calamus]|uniref:Uncharacterized protein n=1 Tax=Acorus calamus TaxID=4465 RepID=A0AAV9C809_ACOCL|nr:hypothetical protein QJS10_CPB21g00752 [Acorus calamus]
MRLTTFSAFSTSRNLRILSSATPAFFAGSIAAAENRLVWFACEEEEEEEEEVLKPAMDFEPLSLSNCAAFTQNLLAHLRLISLYRSLFTDWKSRCLGVWVFKGFWRLKWRSRDWGFL